MHHVTTIVCAATIVASSVASSSASPARNGNIIYPTRGSCISFITNSPCKTNSVLNTISRLSADFRIPAHLTFTEEGRDTLDVVRYPQHNRDGAKPLPERVRNRNQNTIDSKKRKTRRRKLRQYFKAKASENEQVQVDNSLISAFSTSHNRQKRTNKRSQQLQPRSKLASTVIEELSLSLDQEFRSKDLRLWANATDVRTLRLMFGTNRNKFWGDLDNETTRRLYHTLLPRALIGLYRQGMAPEVLAPLAFEVRRAAKQYARERCQVPGRLSAIVYDGFRHLKTYGSWSSKGLSWEEIWEKYEQQVREEMLEIGEENMLSEGVDLSSKISVRILERSCVTNEQIDQLVLTKTENGRENEAKMRLFLKMLMNSNEVPLK